MTWPVLSLTPIVALQAIVGVRDHRLSYWDAHLWSTARLNRIPTVLSEDVSHGRTIDGVRFVDPFRADFDGATLGS